MPAYTCLIAPPLVFPSTRAQLLASACGLDLLSAVELRERAGNERAAADAQLDTCVRRGRVVSPAVLAAAAADAMSESPPGTLFVLSGFPQSLSQAEALSRMCGPPQFVVHVDASEEADMSMCDSPVADAAGELMEYVHRHWLVRKVTAIGRPLAEVDAELQRIFESPPLIQRERIPTGQRGTPRSYTLQVLHWNVLADGLSGNCKGVS